MSLGSTADGTILPQAVDVCVGAGDGTVSRWTIEMQGQDDGGYHASNRSTDTGPIDSDDRASTPAGHLPLKQLPFPHSLSKCGTTLEAVAGAVSCITVRGGIHWLGNIAAG